MPSRWVLTTPSPEQLQEFRSDPRHWNPDGSYNCALDPRLMVRDRLELGWTLNMAHPRAQTVIWSILAGTIAMALLLALVVV